MSEINNSKILVQVDILLLRPIFPPLHGIFHGIILQSAKYMNIRDALFVLEHRISSTPNDEV